MREIRRRTRVVGAFPDGQSALNPAAARLKHIAGTEWSMKRYMNMQLLRQNKMIAQPDRAPPQKNEKSLTLPFVDIPGPNKPSSASLVALGRGPSHGDQLRPPNDNPLNSLKALRIGL